MKKAFVVSGVSASGKSTWAREFVEKNPTFVIIERDAIRADILAARNLTQPGDGVVWAKWKWKWEKDVTALADEMLEAAAIDEDITGVILSDTNLNADRRAALVQKLSAQGFDVEEKFFDVTWSEAVKRDNARKNGVGVSVLADQFAKLHKSTVKQYVGNSANPKAVIVDIDGTLAAMSGRSAFDWARVGEDTANEEVVDVVRGLHTSGYKVIVMSGRDGVCRNITEQWLNTNGIPFDEFYIRTAGDNRNDGIIKSELFWTHVANKFNVKLVIDDRPQVCRVWRSMGLKVMQCGNPLIEF